MFPVLIYIVSGIVLLMVPHFVLPIELIEGGRKAWLLTTCSFWYHPESILAMLLLAAGIFRAVSRRVTIFVGVLAVLLAGQGVVLRPLSYYLQTSEKIITLGQTISIRSHAGLRPLLLAFAGLLLATVIFDWIRSHRGPVKRPVSFGRLCLANIRKKLFRSVSLVLALAVIIGAFFGDVLLTRSIGNTLQIGAGRLGADLVVVPKGHEDQAREILINGTPNVFELPESVYEQLRQWPEVAQCSPQLFFRPFSYLVCCTTEKVLVVGYDPETDFTIAPWVNYHLHESQQENELVVGSQVKFYPGQSISIFGRKLSIAASLDYTSLGYFDRTAFIPLNGAKSLIRFLKENEAKNRLHERRGAKDLSLAHLFDSEKIQKDQQAEIRPENISVLFVKVKENTDVKLLARTIEEKIEGVSVVNVRSATTSVKRQLTSMLDAVFLPILILIGMGTIILTVIFSMSANERQKEIGLLRAMGAKKRDIFRLFLAESLLISSLGGLFGILGGGAMLILFKNKIMASLDLIYIWPSLLTVAQVFGITFLVAICIGIGSGLYPSLKAAKLEPYQAIRGN